MSALPPKADIELSGRMRVWPSFSVALEEQELEGEFRIPAGGALGYGHILVGFNAHV